MPADHVLVIDAGTSSLRAIAVAADGTVERLAAEELPCERPGDGSEFAREFDVDTTPEYFAGVLLHDAHRRGVEPVALAFTGQREAAAFVDQRGDAVMLSPNIDARAAAEGAALDARLGERIYDTTGHLPSLLTAPAKLQWMRKHRPDDAGRVHAVLPFVDWLASQLTGEMTGSRNLLCEIGLLDVRTAEPSRALTMDLLDTSAVGVVHRAAVGGSTETAGRVRKGPFAGTPVVLAGGDTQCGSLGAGVHRDGDCAVIAGWSAPLQLVLDRPLLDEKRRTWTGLHVAPDRWVLESSAGDTGRAWDWVSELLHTPGEGYALPALAPAGSRDAMMVIGRAPMNAAAMTAGVGALTFPLPLAMWSLDRGSILRATLEAAAYAIRANVEQLEEVSGRRIDVLRMGGGMSRGELFAQIITDALDRPIEVARSPETTALGAAMLAFVAIGRFASIEEAVEAMARPRRTVTPNARDSATYDDCYARWRELAAHMERSP